MKNLPQQPISQDPTMPPLETPNADNTIEEVKRRLIEEAEGGHAYMLPPQMEHKPWLSTLSSNSVKQDYRSNAVVSHYSGSDGQTYNSNEKTSTVVLYQLPGEKIPFKVSVEKRDMTLSNFKALISRKGQYKFYFKQYSTEIAAAAWVEIEKDDELLPHWQKTIVARVEKA